MKTKFLFLLAIAGGLAANPNSTSSFEADELVNKAVGYFQLAIDNSYGTEAVVSRGNSNPEIAHAWFAGFRAAKEQDILTLFMIRNEQLNEAAAKEVRNFYNANPNRHLP